MNNALGKEHPSVPPGASYTTVVIRIGWIGIDAASVLPMLPFLARMEHVFLPTASP